MGQASNRSQMMIGGHSITVTRKRQKNVYLRVKQGQVSVSAPLTMPQAEITHFIESKSAWINRHVDADRRRNDQWRRWPNAPGEEIQIWGQRRHLRNFDRNWVADDTRLAGNACRHGWYLTDDELRVCGTQQLTAHVMRQVLSELLRCEIDSMLDRWGPIVGRLPRHVTIRPMTSRWGSCRKETRRITLNLYLIHLERAYLEYVLIHELTHLHVRGHGDQFYRRMDQYAPGWKRLRRELNQYSLV